MSLTSFLAFANNRAAEGGEAGGGSLLVNMIPFAMMILIFYFLIIRPNQQRQKKHKAMLSAVKKGDRILTTGGLYATVLNTKEDLVVAEISNGVKVEVARSAIGGIVGDTKD